MKTVLALDLGTKTGYAVSNSAGFMSGTWKLSTPKEVTDWGRQRLTRRCDPRIIRLAQAVRGLPVPDLVIFEDVQFSSYTLQVQLWASFRAAVWLSFSTTPSVIFECVDVGTLKKFATGHGGATKEMMRAALLQKYPELVKKGCDDNEIDAIWLHRWARANLTR